MNKHFYILCFFLFSNISFGQKWKKVFDPFETLRFCEMQITNDEKINVITRSSFTQHHSKTLNKEGDVISSFNFNIPMGGYRPFDYASLGNNQYAVLCRSNASSVDVSQLIKFNKDGNYFWSAKTEQDDHNLRPARISQDGDNLIVTGVVQSKTSPEEGSKMFLFEYDGNGNEVNKILINTNIKFNIGLNCAKKANGNYYLLEGKIFESAVTSIGGMFILDYFLLEISPNGKVLNRIPIPKFCRNNVEGTGLVYSKEDERIIITTPTSILVYDENFNLIFQRELDMYITNMDFSNGEILVIGESLGFSSGRPPQLIVCNLDGEILVHKSYFNNTSISSTNNGASVMVLDNGYVFSGLNTIPGFFESNYIYKTDQFGSSNAIVVNDILSDCNSYPIDYNMLLAEYDSNCSQENLSFQVVDVKTIGCLNCTGSSIIDNIKWTLVDSCGNVDTASQLIHYENIKPELICCDYQILDQNEDGTTIVFNPILVNSPCELFNVVNLNDFEINENLTFPNGEHILNFGLVNPDCEYDTIFQSYAFEIASFDTDGDGSYTPFDCDDMDSSINPSATEIVNNEVDEDCDGVALVVDDDMDGYNSDEDCDDLDSLINPDAIEIVNNEVDEDCDGVALVIDEDMDGYNSDEDCDDFDSLINPGAIEIVNNEVDEDCDGIAFVIDEDMDGYNSDEDCDDLDSLINPGAIEIANNKIDEDCDGMDLISSSYDLVQYGIKLFPNPSRDLIYIETKTNEKISIKIFDLIGNEVLADFGKNKFDISNLNSGIYLCKIRLMGNKNVSVIKLFVI